MILEKVSECCPDSRVGYYYIAGVLTTDLESHATLTSLMANIYDRSQTDSTLQQFDAASCLLHISNALDTRRSRNGIV